MSTNALTRTVLFLPFTVPLFILPQVEIFRYNGALWALVALAYLYISPVLLDLISGREGVVKKDRPIVMFDGLEYRLLLRCLAVIIVCLKIYILYAARGLTSIDLIGTALISGQILGAYSMVLSHELFHKRSRIDRIFSEILLVTTTYPQYVVDHLNIHHKHVATPGDPASASLGESFYWFFPKVVIVSMRQVWNIEAHRLQLRNLPWYSVQNRIMRYALEVFILYLVVYEVFGSNGVTIIAVQSFMGIFTLRVVDYVQHYGLRRKLISPGVYERIGVQHSWNSGYRFSNSYWIAVARHSDHHCAGNKPFQMLDDLEDRGAPQWPAGLPLMFLAALVPPVWFRLMNSRVEAWQDAQASYRQAASDNSVWLEASRDREAFEGLRSLQRSGKIRILLENVPHTLRRTLLHSEVERFGGVLAILGFVAFLIGDAKWGMPWGLIALTMLFIVVGAARYSRVRLASDNLLADSSLRSLPVWQDLWSQGYVKIRSANGVVSVGSAPLGDWRAVLEPGR